jgi:glycerol uptake operon antiterminator
MKSTRKVSPPSPVAAWLNRSIIPVIWRTDADPGVLARARVIFVQGCELAELPVILDWLRSGPCGPIPIMVHVDLLAGLTSDDAGLRYLVGLRRIDGIITVRSHMVAAARRHGLASILLLFLQDGRSIDRGLHIIEQSRPDAVELVPGVAALETAAHFEHLTIPRIAGGLVRTPATVRRLLDSGFDAVSSSSADLWRLNPETHAAG